MTQPLSSPQFTSAFLSRGRTVARVRRSRFEGGPSRHPPEASPAPVILLDTGPLVALCDGRDARHSLAVSQLRRLLSNALCTCDPVLTEACFHLPHRRQRQRLQALLDELDIDGVSTNDQSFRAAVIQWLLKYADHEPDWADGCIAVLSGRDPTLKIWTYDGEFRTRWRRLDGRSIPLAVRA